MNVLFKILCGCLYVIGLPFGWTYQETSVYICIYGCPAVCLILALLCVYKSSFKTILQRLRFSVNVVILWLYWGLANDFWNYYSKWDDPFNQCVKDIQYIAKELNMTYEECNIYIYVYLFGLIVLFHLIQLIIYRKCNIIKELPFYDYFKDKIASWKGNKLK